MLRGYVGCVAFRPCTGFDTLFAFRCHLQPLGGEKTTVCLYVTVNAPWSLKPGIIIMTVAVKIPALLLNHQPLRNERKPSATPW
jgi:hypothetical protein